MRTASHANLHYEQVRFHMGLAFQQRVTLPDIIEKRARLGATKEKHLWPYFTSLTGGTFSKIQFSWIQPELPIPFL